MLKYTLNSAASGAILFAAAFWTIPASALNEGELKQLVTEVDDRQRNSETTSRSSLSSKPKKER